MVRGTPMPKTSARLCRQCKHAFHSSDKRRKFCCLECCWKWRSESKEALPGAFKPGLVPRNTGTVGVMKPNSGSFQPGRDSEKKQEIGTVLLRKDKHGGFRAWVKVADNGTSYDWKLRAVVVWEKEHGPISSGRVIHHVDRNKLNDALDNLEVLTRAEHIREHKHEFEEKRINAASKAAKRRHAINRANRRANVESSPAS